MREEPYVRATTTAIPMGSNPHAVPFRVQFRVRQRRTQSRRATTGRSAPKLRRGSSRQRRRMSADTGSIARAPSRKSSSRMNPAAASFVRSYRLRCATGVLAEFCAELLPRSTLRAAPVPMNLAPTQQWRPCGSVACGDSRSVRRAGQPGRGRRAGPCHSPVKACRDCWGR